MFIVYRLSFIVYRIASRSFSEGWFIVFRFFAGADLFVSKLITVILPVSTPNPRKGALGFHLSFCKNVFHIPTSGFGLRTSLTKI
jgi:hypothetical protein